MLVWLPAGRSVAGAEPVWRQEKLAELDAAVRQAVGERACPGAVVWLERSGQVHRLACGKRALEPKIEEMTEDTIFDAASLTKVVATAPSVLLLVERGQLGMDTPVRDILPTFCGEGRETVTIRHLLTHTSGLRAGISPTPEWSGYERGMELACAEKPLTAPGTAFRYSDVNFLLLGEIVRRVSGQALDRFAAREIHQPLGMVDTGFLPPPEKVARIAPTEKDGGVMLRGTVHDPTARRMGGVAGHAGLFTTAADLAKYGRMLVARGEVDGKRVLRPESVAMMTAVQSPAETRERRGLGWDIDSPYSRPRGGIFPLGSFGHTGWTGGCLWVDPFSKTVLVFLTNRNHPSGGGNVLPLWDRLGTLAAEAVADYNLAWVPGALAPREERPATGKPRVGRVRNGIDVLAEQDFAPLKGLWVGLVTNQTGLDRRRARTIDLLKAAPGVQLKVLFSPEHGIGGGGEGNVGDAVDEASGLRVWSLHGERKQPAFEQLAGLDALVFDVQDVGCRFYTYISTLKLCLEAAARAKLRFFVLDRVNPIDGVTVEGPVCRGAETFVACHPLPLRHGMTVGELARMFRAERGWDLDLTVIPVAGWQRERWFDETGLPWTNPSPNMRGVTAAALYPGVGLLEAAVSVGRGTDKPFEWIGAPYVDDGELAAALNGAGLTGVRFVPVRFTPAASTFANRECGGVAITVTDRAAMRAVDVGIVLCLTLRRLYPEEFALDKAAHLLVDPATLEAIRAGKSLAAVKALWEGGLTDFRKRRQRYLLYGER